MKACYKFSRPVYKTSPDLKTPSSFNKYLFYELGCGKLWFSTQMTFSDQAKLITCPDKLRLNNILCHIWLCKEMTSSLHRTPAVDRGAEGTYKQLGFSAI